MFAFPLNLFLGTFKKHGLIEECDGVLQMNPALLLVVEGGPVSFTAHYPRLTVC